VVCSQSFSEPVFLRTLPRIAEKGVDAHDKATLNFRPFAWISLGKHSVHATTNTRDTSSVVQIPMKRPFQETSASEIGPEMLSVNQMRMADAMHALRATLAIGIRSRSRSWTTAYIKPVAKSSVINILRANGTLSCHSEKVGRNRMTMSDAILNAPWLKIMSFTS